MYVQALHGPRAGEVRELSDDVALEMIRLGRVGRAFQDPTPRVPHVATAAEVAAPQGVPACKSGKKKRGK